MTPPVEKSWSFFLEERKKRERGGQREEEEEEKKLAVDFARALLSPANLSLSFCIFSPRSRVHFPRSLLLFPSPDARSATRTRSPRREQGRCDGKTGAKQRAKRGEENHSKEEENRKTHRWRAPTCGQPWWRAACAGPCRPWTCEPSASYEPLF